MCIGVVPITLSSGSSVGTHAGSSGLRSRVGLHDLQPHSQPDLWKEVHQMTLYECVSS